MIKAGQIYRAKAKRGYRYVKITKIRSRDERPYVIAYEVLKSGKRAYGMLHGLPRNIPIRIMLLWDAHPQAVKTASGWTRRPVLKMPFDYELVEGGSS